MKKKCLTTRLSLNKKIISALNQGDKGLIVGGNVTPPTRITLVSVYVDCPVSFDCVKETHQKTGCQELTVITIHNPGCNVPA
ncbi:class I lanthipeptide [Taibaiella koreensis]|uniref:class I lanthipeptide n=1 Tax=Taibaiella koreensis TaxID=1268548 RepID=UPI000E59C761|nr:class I lanthipeptide [Taibaiella koreensis]